MKLKNPDCPLFLYPLVGANLVLKGEPKNLKVDDFRVLIKRNSCNLIEVEGIGFSWVWDNDIDYTLTKEENARL